LHFDPLERALEYLLRSGVEFERGKISVGALVHRNQEIICNHRHDEPLFVLSMVASVLGWVLHRETHYRGNSVLLLAGSLARRKGSLWPAGSHACSNSG